MMPSLLLWDLWVSRYRIRPKQVFMNAGGFLVFYITVFMACIIVPTYFGWNTPEPRVKMVTRDVNPRIIREEMSEEEMRRKLEELQNKFAAFGKSTATSKSFWEGLTGKQRFPYKKFVLQWKWDHEVYPELTRTLKNSVTNYTETYDAQNIATFNVTKCKENFTEENCDSFLSDFYELSFNGIKKPMILGVLIIIGLFVVNIIVLKIIETVREVIYRIYAFWRNTLMCVWCVNWYEEHQESKRDKERTEEYINDPDNDVVFKEIQRRARQEESESKSDIGRGI